MDCETCKEKRAAWIWWESQFEEVKTVETYEANADNGWRLCKS